VTVHVVTPRDLSEEERSLLERLAQLRDEPATGNGAAPRALRRPEFRS
jgi:DnaJ-class molecular chaperone